MVTNSFERLKEVFKNNHTDRMSLVFQWVKDDMITYKQFKELVEYNIELRQRALDEDNFD